MLKGHLNTCVLVASKMQLDDELEVGWVGTDGEMARERGPTRFPRSSRDIHILESSLLCALYFPVGPGRTRRRFVFGCTQSQPQQQRGSQRESLVTQGKGEAEIRGNISLTAKRLKQTPATIIIFFEKVILRFFSLAESFCF